ncbi:hypothetical protein DFH06DRAFT_355995 [Mycena polygramma]|nr:hypothetical protein DFH06DRAFT_355995 [Mycena polygramma]
MQTDDEYKSRPRINRRHSTHYTTTFVPPHLMRRVASTSSSTSSTLAHGYLDKGNDDYAETLIDAPTTSLPTSREDAEASTFMTSTRLRLISVVLHSLLVAIFLALLIISLKEAEHRVVFSLDHQKTVSFAITAITTGFGTIYLGLLVYVTQTISIRRILQTDQTLTAIHDTTAAWAGIGSAVFHLWHQTRVRSSVIGVLSVFGYLGGVLILHVATPSLFAVQTFNSSTLVPVGTYGLPSWNVNWPNGTNVADYAAGSLYSIPTVVESNTSLGLSGGTLYDVLDDHAGVGNVSVSATGFNISCTYPTNMTVSDDLLTASGLKRRQNVVGVQLTAPWFELQGKGIPKPFYMKRSAQYGVISAMTDSPDGPGTISRAEPGPLLLFSTIPIIDSENTRPPMTVLNTSYSQGGDLDAVQVVHCVQRLVPQTAVVDVQSHRLIAVEPNIQKTTSTWVPQDTVVENISTGNTFLDGWAQWYLAMPPSTFPLYPPIPDLPYLSVGASYLIEKLQMHPSTSANASAHPGNVTLHDLENALSTLVASVFWTLGHVPPVANTATRDVLPSPQLIRGSATVTQVLTLGRLDSNIIAILIGLCASVFVTTLAFPSLLGRHGAKNNDLPIDSTGILHTMWLYRNHPALRTTLQQIELPTTNGLRKAGMIRTKVYNGDSHLLHASFIETHDAFFNEKAPYTDVPPDLPPTSLPHYREGRRLVGVFLSLADCDF